MQDVRAFRPWAECDPRSVPATKRRSLTPTWQECVRSWRWSRVNKLLRPLPRQPRPAPAMDADILAFDDLHGQHAFLTVGAVEAT